MGVKLDEAYQLAMSDCKIKIDTFFNDKNLHVGKQSDKVVWTRGTTCLNHFFIVKNY